MENALHYGQTADAGPGESSVLLGLRHVSHLVQPDADKLQATPANSCGYLEFTVIDHGPGLNSEDCAVATQRFWRKQHQAHGSGLGLAIVQRIAQSGGGELELLPLAQWRQQNGQAEPAVTGLVARLCLPIKPCAALPD